MVLEHKQKHIPMNRIEFNDKSINMWTFDLRKSSELYIYRGKTSQQIILETERLHEKKIMKEILPQFTTRYKN